MPRLFIAVDIPEDIKKDLSIMCSGIPGAKWVKSEQLHLTLRFIGDVDHEFLRDMTEALAEIKTTALTLRLKGTGCFPSRKKARVLWVGIEHNEQLAKLKNKVETTVVNLGMEPEGRKFSPHITLARLRNTPANKLTNFLGANTIYASRPFPVEQFLLYSSVLTPNGAIHTIEAAYPLVEQG